MKALTKSVSLLVILALALGVFFAASLIMSENAHAAVAKAAVKKAKTYKKSTNKLFTVKGAYYCFSKKKVKKGIQKVGKKYYFFSTSTGKMYLKTGLKKVGTAYYYFKKASGKAPAYTKNSWKDADNNVWFFTSNGKRYKYSYKDTGSTAGNTSAGIIISEAGIKPDGTGREEDLAKAYEKIVKRSTGGLNKSGYQSIIPPDLVSNSWIGSYAKKLANDKAGNCYCYSALTFVTFKALGGNPTLVTGKCSRTGDLTKNQDHAWVENKKLVYDSVFDLSKKEMAFLGKEMDDLKGKDYKNKEFKLKNISEPYSAYIYTPDKTNTFK